VSYRLWKWLASSSPIYGTAPGQFSSKQFSPFMELAVINKTLDNC
jgi:hypothetical protein